MRTGNLRTRSFQESFTETLQILVVLVGLPVLAIGTLFAGAQLGSRAGVFSAYGLLWFFVIRRLYE
jgi:hypothetical protein